MRLLLSMFLVLGLSSCTFFEATKKVASTSSSQKRGIASEDGQVKMNLGQHVSRSFYQQLLNEGQDLPPINCDINYADINLFDGSCYSVVTFIRESDNEYSAEIDSDIQLHFKCKNLEIQLDGDAAVRSIPLFGSKIVDIRRHTRELGYEAEARRSSFDYRYNDGPWQTYTPDHGEAFLLRKCSDVGGIHLPQEIRQVSNCSSTLECLKQNSDVSVDKLSASSFKATLSITLGP